MLFPSIIIGDVHCKYYEYKNILDKYKVESSLQLGDFGFDRVHKLHLNELDSTRHKVLLGNHDDYRHLYSPHSLGDHGSNSEMFWVRGAFSIDKHLRTEGVDWFANEELTYQELINAFDAYAISRPKVMFSHDCPHEVRKHLFGITDKSTTCQGLQVMFEEHQPDIWIFGHHHKKRDEVINGTRFICLEELGVFKF